MDGWWLMMNGFPKANWLRCVLLGFSFPLSFTWSRKVAVKEYLQRVVIIKLKLHVLFPGQDTFLHDWIDVLDLGFCSDQISRTIVNNVFLFTFTFVC